MKKFPLPIRSLSFVFCTLLYVSLSAQNIRPIDVNKQKNSYPQNFEYSTLNMYAELNGVFYFDADDGIHGDELWRSDGTPEGTYIVKDINPGAASAYINDIVISGNKIYFSAFTNDNGQELWASDGTETGTYLVSDVNFSNLSSNPSFITDVNGTVYFVTSGFGYRDQLWKTDGTQTGTALVADFGYSYPFYGNNARQLTNVNGRLFFTLNTYNYDPQLYATDGTPEGTYLVKEINQFGQDNPSNFTVVNGLLYFSADDGTGSGRLWVSDGTDPGTHAVNNTGNIYVPLYYGDEAAPFAVKNNILYLQGYDVAGNYELYKYNTANASAVIRLVKDIVPGSNGSYPANIRNVNGTLFFTIGPVDADAQLWKSDGTSTGTVLVKDINPGGKNYYYGLIGANGMLMFAYANNTSGFELWKSDGTDIGTVMVKEICPGPYSSYPGFFTNKTSTFIFSAYNGVKGRELWKSDGTGAGTVLIKDINQSATSSSNPAGFTASGTNKAVFRAFDNTYGDELRVTDGYNAGTKLLKDLNEGSDGSSPSFFTNFQNNTYFFAYTGNGYYLGKTNGTTAGTSLFYQLNVSGYVQAMVATDNLLYFTIYNYVNDFQELWRSDGTESGTYPIRTDLVSYYSLNSTGVGNTLFFTYYDDLHGFELWKSNGTTAGTKLVKDIFTGYNSSYPSNLYNFNGKLYFSADAGYGPFLWTSDGTSNGTTLVKAAIIQPSPFAQANGKLFFNAYSTVANGNELYATDGTTTRLVKDINRGPNSSYPNNLVNGDTLLYFMANDGKNGFELWVSDGVKEGTHLVKNITPGIDNSYFNAMVNVNDKLFFTAFDTLWQSDATEEGTHKVEDETLNGVVSIYDLTSVGDRLYFTGYSYAIGREAYTARVSDIFRQAPLIAQNLAATPLIKTDDAFGVKLLTNPIRNGLKLAINTSKQQAVLVTITDASGKIMVAASQIISAGATLLSYNANAWMHGLYIIKVTMGDGTVSVLKAVK